MTGCDSESRQRNSSDFGVLAGRIGQPSSFRIAQIHQQTNQSQRFIGHTPDAEAPHLDQAGQRRRRTHQQAAMFGLDLDTVVANQAHERQPNSMLGLEQRERQPRLARSGRSPDQNGACANEDGGGVDGGRHSSYLPSSRKKFQAWSNNRQPHHESRAQHLGRAVFGCLHADAILRPESAAVGLDDLLGDRQA